MAFETGGYADKLGNRYEGRWVIKQLLRVLLEEIRSVTVEAIGDDEVGVDLVVERNDGTRQFQQCKARNASNECWSMAQLNSRGILGRMKFQLDRGAMHEYALVSALPCTVVGDICESARLSSGKPDDFYSYQVKKLGEPRCTAFRNLCEHWGLDEDNESERATAFDWLRRTYIIMWADDQDSQADLAGLARILVCGEPRVVIACLAEFAQDSLRHCLTAPAIRAFLSGRGLHPRRLDQEDRVAPAVEALQKRFEDSVSGGLLCGQVIPREETQQLVNALAEHHVVIVHGTRGYGKSGVLYELSQRMKSAGWRWLPVRLDRQEPRNSTKQFGEDIGLPESPVLCLNALLAEERGVLIIDQLDALRWTSAHSANALEVCKALVREVISFRAMGKDILVVLSCRTFDLENDPEIKGWLTNQAEVGQRSKRIEVKGLPNKTVAEIVERCGGSYGSMTERQKHILSSPLHLAMWITIGGGRRPEFQTSTQLMREFWKTRYQELAKRGIRSQEADEVLDMLVDYMEGHGTISAPASLIDRRADVYTELQSLGIIRTDENKVVFWHQNYLDFRIADRVLREIHRGEGDIRQWLGAREEQSLFRREQLRQVLMLLTDDDATEFVKNIRALLGDGDVRFHLKHLILEIVGQIEAPDDELGEYVLELLNDESWRRVVLEGVVYGHPQYVKLLIGRAYATEWLNATDDRRGRMLWLLRGVAEKIPDAIAELLEPYVERAGPWPQQVLNAMWCNVETDSDKMFELRLQLARMGLWWDHMGWAKLAGKNPLRVIRLIEAIISTWRREGHGAAGEEEKSKLREWMPDELKAIKDVAGEYPDETWELLMPHIERLTAVGNVSDEGASRRWTHTWLDIDERQTPVCHGLVQMLQIAGSKLAEHKPQEFLNLASAMEGRISRVIDLILIQAYSHIHHAYADEAIRYLLADTARFGIGEGLEEAQWMPAVRLVEAQSPHCTDSVFLDLENRIMVYHLPDETEEAKYYLGLWRRGYFHDYWGRAQHFLLPALAHERRSKRCSELIGVLQRKFDRYKREEFLRHAPITGGMIGSPLQADRLDMISDDAWLAIVKNKTIPEKSWDWRQVGPDRAAESSIEHFAVDLGTVAKRYPDRFARLALRFPDDVHPRYLGAVLDGVKTLKNDTIPESARKSWRPARIEDIEALLKRFCLGDDRSVAHYFCWLMSERPKENWSQRAIRRLADYAMKHPDPEPGKLNVRSDKAEYETTIDCLTENAINCIRGIAAGAIGNVLWEHPEWLQELRPALEHLVNDAHPAVRVASLKAVMPLLNIDRDLAIDLFLLACREDKRVAACRYGANYFKCGMAGYTSRLSPLILEMCNSDNDDIAEEGAKEVCARWLFQGLFETELKNLVQGRVCHRKGIAQVAASLLTKEKYAGSCRGLLSKFFEDEDREVRAAASRAMFNRVDILSLDGLQTFVENFVHSPAFADDPSGLLYTFKDYKHSLLPYAETVFAICAQFTGPLADLARDMSQRIRADVSEVNAVLLRLYEQTRSCARDVHSRCLDMWDALFQKGISGGRDLVTLIDA